MKVKKILSIVLGLSIFSFSLVVWAQDNTSPFSDVNNTDPNYQAIVYIKNRNIIDGYPDGTFKPDQIVNRAEALKMMLIASNIATPDTQDKAFPDLGENAWYLKYVSKAKNTGIIQGYPDGKFRPEQTVNLVEALKMLLNARGTNLDDVGTSQDAYADTPKDNWYAKFIGYAKQRNLIDADASNKVNPGQGLTRGKLAQIIYRLLNSDQQALTSKDENTTQITAPKITEQKLPAPTESPNLTLPTQSQNITPPTTQSTTQPATQPTPPTTTQPSQTANESTQTQPATQATQPATQATQSTTQLPMPATQQTTQPATQANQQKPSTKNIPAASPKAATNVNTIPKSNTAIKTGTTPASAQTPTANNKVPTKEIINKASPGKISAQTATSLPKTSPNITTKAQPETIPAKQTTSTKISSPKSTSTTTENRTQTQQSSKTTTTSNKQTITCSPEPCQK